MPLTLALAVSSTDIGATLLPLSYYDASMTTESPRSFRSDNNAGLCPEALRALIDANGGHAVAYGDDAATAAAERAFRHIFGDECAAFFVATGTAANTLAIASLTEPWQRVICHHHSHYNDDESTAPEHIAGCRCAAIHTDAAKLTPEDVLQATANARGDVHQPQPGVLTLSNATEFGTVYMPQEMRELCEVAHERGYRVHVDGARFANAVASLGCNPRAIANDAGIDALSFGGTKNGLAFGEAVLFFPQRDGLAYQRARASFPFHRKSTGHLLSKHRFVAAQFAAVLRSDDWLTHARQANAMARKLGEGLAKVGLLPRFPVEANGVFVSLPAHVDEHLRRRGHQYYPFGEAAWNVVRLMCSFDTEEADVEALLKDIAQASG